MIGRIPAFGHLGVPFSGKTGPVTGFTKEIHIELLNRIRSGGIMPARGSVTASGKPGQDGRTTHPADGLADEGIVEPGTIGGQLIDIGCLDQGMTVTSK